MKEMEGLNIMSEYAKKAEAALNNIVHAADDNKVKSEAIVRTVEEMKGFSENVKKAMDTLIKINVQNSQAIEEITAATSEMNQQVTENNKVALNLSNLAQSQEDLIAQFAVNNKMKAK